MDPSTLSKTLEDHAAWLRDPSTGRRAYLGGADLRGAALTGAYLDRAALVGADLDGASLVGASLTGAYLGGADLDRADLTGADLYRADLYRANLGGADLTDANLGGAYLAGADLAGATLYRADLTGANLAGATLTGAYLRGASLRGASLRGANLRGATLTGANFTGANLTGTVLDPSATLTPPTVADLVAEGFEVRAGWVYGWRTRTSRHVGNTTYEVGKTYTAPWFSVDATSPCHPGIYVATRTWLDRNYYGDDLVRVRFRRSDVLKAGDKYRVRTITVVSF